ncbi:DUF58 domain-containing protein [Paenibacillus campi]|uniref:DUF58 domain-containing protein n=1 Tax=Paenibacillus campi TaxID=3106031 RepID=UPI002AFF6CEC|nr:DUF58 domain-containing protein [Paenibacillus sp. SGZ-1014]
MALFWLMVVAVLVAAAQAVLFGKHALTKLLYTRRLSAAQCHVGEPLEMIEELENRRALPLPWLRLEAMLPVAFQFAGSADLVISEGTVYQNHQSLFSLGRRVRIVRRHRMLARQRGCYRLDSVSMSVGDLFGLVRVTRPLQLQLDVSIYPAYLPSYHMPEAYSSWQGELEMRRWINEDPFLMTGVRQYRIGDPMNQVHWAATARTGELQVYQHGYSADPEVMIVLNIELSEQMWNTVTEPVAAEYAISCAATIVADLLGRGMKAGFAHNAIIPYEQEERAFITPAYGTEQLYAILQMMAELQLKIRRPFAQFIRSLMTDDERSIPTDMLLITPYVSEAMELVISELRALAIRVDVLLLPELDEMKQQYRLLMQQAGVASTGA